MRALVALVALVALAACSDPRSDNLDFLGIDKDSTASGSGDGLTMNQRPADAWTDPQTDPTASEEIEEAPYDASQGFKIQEGTAGIVKMAAIFDDRVDTAGYKILQGDLKLTNPSPDLLEIQLLPKENRRFVVTGNKLGHVDLRVEIDGAPGAVTVPIDIVPLTDPQ